MAKSLFQFNLNTEWASYSDEELLQLKLKDVAINVKDTSLWPYVEKLYSELDRKGLSHFRPNVWISDEWFTPDGYKGIAIPFYLTHCRLADLENKMLYEVEGGTPRWFMQLLRHECGHAIDNAYKLRRKRKRQQVFGKSTTPYHDYYSPKPFSKNYVVHLDSWYSQSHPDEDFAETFAVWLDPRSKWRREYKDWGAIKKLNYMDELMKSISNEKPVINHRRTCDSIFQINKTLKDHYEERKKYYGLDYPDIYDVHLYKLFSAKVDAENFMKATEFIKKVRKEVRKTVSPWTGVYQYTIDQLLEEIIKRVSHLDLNLRYSFDKTKLQFISMISILTMEYIHSGKNRIMR